MGNRQALYSGKTLKKVLNFSFISR